MTKVTDSRASADDEWLQKLAKEPKRGQPGLIAVEWTSITHPSKAGQKKPVDTWDVVVREWRGGEFCRRSWPTRTEAEESKAKLCTELIGCDGDVLGALEKWAGCRVQVPLWWDR